MDPRAANLAGEGSALQDRPVADTLAQHAEVRRREPRFDLAKSLFERTSITFQ